MPDNVINIQRVPFALIAHCQYSSPFLLASGSAFERCLWLDFVMNFLTRALLGKTDQQQSLNQRLDAPANGQWPGQWPGPAGLT
jgi:hypothetical protein